MRYEGDERRRSQSFPEGRSYPLWAQLIRDFGFPIAVTVFFLGMFAGYVPSPISRTEAMMTQHTAGEWERARILRVMCRHQALALKASADECDFNGRH